MNTEIIGQVWDSVAGRRVEIIQTFYTRFFERYPQYQRHFPETMDHQMEKMVETISTLARFSEDPAILRPHLMKLGQAHKAYGLSSTDLHNFKEIFVESIAAACPDVWNTECERAWNDAFNQVIIPTVEQGLRI
jgi:hemoglobin-like flavoprotein